MRQLLWYAYGLTSVVLSIVGLAVLLEQRDAPGMVFGCLLVGTGVIWLLHFLSPRRN